jgi:hypothetical protein
MPVAVVAFAFGAPNTLRSNRCIAEMASRAAKTLNAAVYTQRDVMPIEPGIEVELTQENYPQRVPTLRIARSAISWARERGHDELWICAAKPHIARCLRDLHYAIEEANAEIALRLWETREQHPIGFWFCAESAQPDTRLRTIWQARDAVLMNMPMRLYATVAS